MTVYSDHEKTNVLRPDKSDFCEIGEVTDYRFISVFYIRYPNTILHGVNRRFILSAPKRQTADDVKLLNVFRRQ